MAGGDAEIGTRTTEKAGARFERSLEVAIGFLTKDVDFDCLGFVERLESHDALHEERLGIFEVYMEEGHHREGGVYALDLPGHVWGVSFYRTKQGHHARASRSRKGRSPALWSSRACRALVTISETRGGSY